MLENMDVWKNMAFHYQFALRELETKIMIVNTEWKLQDGYSPIEHIKTRLKEPASIMKKLERKRLPKTLESVRDKLFDVAGVRIVCAFVEDIYRIADHFKQREDLRLVEIKDYIASPKPNGYQSLHLIVQVPLVLNEGIQWVNAEIQLRTLAMDFWASLEHILFYKYDKQVPPYVLHELTEAAEAANSLDQKMLRLRKEILNGKEFKVVAGAKA
ncbi:MULTISPECIES: GTP pyrophosphokinase [Brevibacillus]|uniref:GTP pyrophosphokinase n=1 Tax=Brevibacillus laterosporus TaxID=1465 RepID=A0AAP3GB59_BRELA|nr:MULTISPECIES: GTP pyrophosphokinase family protein [Brevibacillus]ATO48033.1 GTP pyrophosphokinase [Brevibacillus laterosporus DSM 25]AYB37199.1 GTP pyrophosphokinase family protein [Brevibacillus laterosporus]MBG9773625.1 GTP pyrophosphokinase [Brevibacillus laterosporus]MBG9788179.1 GTP pyrophosphokinase [Brevibacillus laterosporus]MBG9799980.1 GTP pyrophosphokinase [Brevibacillus laterosporus]